MEKFKAIFRRDGVNTEFEVGTYTEKSQAIKALLDYAENHASYCLDSRADRQKALEERDACICGCGPSSMEIIEE